MFQAESSMCKGPEVREGMAGPPAIVRSDGISLGRLSVGAGKVHERC